MTVPQESGLCLQTPGGGRVVTALEDVNAALAALGTRVWPLDVGAAPADLQGLLGQASLSEAEVERLKAHFLLSRERLLEIIAGAGRTPHVPGGGALATFVIPHDYAYPQLYVVEPGVDYSRFDRFHVNRAGDGMAVDEVMQILSGGGVRLDQRESDGGVSSLELECPDGASGWALTYDGGRFHIGSLSGATVGTKVLMQIIGPARWQMVYEDEGSA